jgi:hypothetical protein
MSKTLAELKADVIVVTKRPDLAADVEFHTKNAILKAHAADYWLNDLYENAFQFAAAATEYSLEYKVLLPRWKKIKYLNVIDSITGEIVRKVDPIPLEKFLDGYGYKQDYVFYQAGDYLKIRASGQEQAYGFGCYLYPDTTLAYPSWIADEFPFVIVYEAARTLFKAIGFDEQSTAMEKLLAEAMAELRMVGITTVGE